MIRRWIRLPPLDALIPTIQLGLGEDSNCSSLLQDVEAGARTPPKPTGGKATITRDKSTARPRAPGGGG